MELLYIKILKELSDNKIDYALLRKPINWQNIGDLDIIFRKEENIHNKLERLGYLNKRNSTTYIKYDFFYKKWIYLDLNNPLKFGNQYAQTNLINDLIDNKYIDDKGINRINETYEAILTLIHAATNKGFISLKYRHLIYENNINESFLGRYNDELNLSDIYQYLLILRTNSKKEKYILNLIRRKLIKPNLNFLNTKFIRIKNILDLDQLYFLGLMGLVKVPSQEY